MRKINYFYSLLLTALFLLPWSGIKADELTTSSGNTSTYLPIYGTWADADQHNQFIIPSSELEDMQNGTITGLKFYAKSNSVSWTNGSAPTITVSMANVTISNLSSGFYNESMTQVWSGTFSVSSGEWTLSFAPGTSFVYGEGNLLIDISSTTGGGYASSLSFDGFNVSNGGRYSYNSTNNLNSFVPKTTFTYTPAATSCPKPTLTLNSKDDKSASFSWTAGGTETQWLYLNLPAATTLTAEHWSSATLTEGNSVTINSLSANTDYAFYLRAYCSSADTSKVVKKDFSTDCSLVSVPTDGITYDFEESEDFIAGSLPDCWFTLKSATTEITPATYAYSSGYNSTAQSLHFQGYGSSYKTIVVLPKYALDIKNLKMSFYYKNGATGTTRPQFAIGYVTNPKDISTYHELTTYTRNTSWTSASINFSAAQYSSIPDGAYIAICHCYGSSNSSHGYIDNVKIESTTDCSKPSVTSVAQTGTGTATATWTAKDGVTSYQYCYVESGEEPDWSGNLTIGTNSVELTSVPAGNYDFYVKCVCGGDPSDAASFTITACQAITNVEHASDLFNGTTITWKNGGSGPWDVYYSTDGGSNWTKSNTSNITSREYALSGLTPGNEYTIEVRNDCGSTASTTYSPVYTAPTGLAVASANITDVTAQATWNAVADVTTGYKYICQTAGSAAPNASAWASAATTTNTYADLSGLTVNTSYDFYVCSNYGGNLSAVVGPVNFITVAQQPANVHLTADPSDTEATITWEAGGAETQWQYLCVTKNTAPYWTGVEPVSSSALPITVSGLTALTDYDFYVRSYYSSTVQSVAVKLPFKTDCGTYSMPFTEHFSSTSSIPSCWSNAEGTTYYETYKWNPYGYDGHTGSGGCVRFNSTKSNTSGYTSYLETPTISLTDDAILDFYWKDPYGATYVVYISVNGAARTTLKSLTATQSSWKQEKIDLSEHKGKNIKLYFYAESNYTSNSYVWLDEVQVYVKPCDAPEFAVANVEATSDGAIISCAADKWSLRYREYNAEPAASWITVNDITSASHTLTGLSTEKTYEVQVKAVCSATRSSSWTASQTFTPVACPAVTAVNFGDKTYNSVVVNWSASAAGTFELQYKAEGETDWTDAVGTIVSPFTLEGLTTGTAYSVRVKANCAEDWVEAATTFTPAYTAPANAAVASITDAAASASWDAVADAPNGYKYIVVEAGETPNWASATATDELTASLSGLAGLTDYDFYVAAVYGEHVEAAAAVNFQTIAVAPTDLVQGATTTNSITFSWSYAGAASQFQWKSSKAGSVWSAPISELTATEAGLTGGTSYTIYVRAYYADGKYSSELSETFGTECAVLSLPFSQDFEDGVSPLCWTAATSTADYYDYDGNYGWKVKEDNDGNYVMRYKSGTALTMPALTLPQIDLTATPAVLSFKVLNNYSNKTVAGNVTVSAEGVDDLVTTLTTSSSLTEQRIDLSDFAGKRITVKFQATSNTNGGRIDLDDIRILEQLTLADGVDNTETLNTWMGRTADVTIGRTFVCADYYNTLCLPFDLSAEQLAESPIATTDLWAFKYARVESGELLIRIIETDHINAGEPYLIAWPEGDNIVNPLFKNVTISASAGKTMGEEELQFVGTLKPETFAAHDQTKLFLYTNNTLYWWDGDAPSSLKSFRAFFSVAGGAGTSPIMNMPARLITSDEQAPTGVDNVSDGMQVIKVLEGDQVIIIRNGVKYSIQGQKIQ